MYIKDARISDCGLYRYSLSRMWEKAGKLVCFVMLNPSTADADADDPTVKKCVKFAKAWGFGGIVVANLFAYRATDPSVLKTVADPVGLLNTNYIHTSSYIAEMTICAWGNMGAFKDRDKKVFSVIKNPHCLKVNKTGMPSHPLYINIHIQPKEFKLR